MKYPKQFLKNRSALDSSIFNCPPSYTMNSPRLNLNTTNQVQPVYNSSGVVCTTIKRTRNIKKLIINTEKSCNLKVMRYIPNPQYVKICIRRDFLLQFYQTKSITSSTYDEIYLRMTSLKRSIKYLKGDTYRDLHHLAKCFFNASKDTEISLTLSDLFFKSSSQFMNKVINIISQKHEVSTFNISLTSTLR